MARKMERKEEERKFSTEIKEMRSGGEMRREGCIGWKKRKKDKQEERTSEKRDERVKKKRIWKTRKEEERRG